MVALGAAGILGGVLVLVLANRKAQREAGGLLLVLGFVAVVAGQAA